jgi:hypothetical protein
MDLTNFPGVLKVFTALSAEFTAAFFLYGGTDPD